MHVKAEKGAVVIAVSSTTIMHAYCRAIAPKSTTPSFAITSPSFSTHPWYLASQGEGAFCDSTTATMCGTSPEFEAAVVGVARVLLILPSSLL
jgi:histidinol-phosphate/aromatic aminotransferase/cobyric acid decarboxylase-like protein